METQPQNLDLNETTIGLSCIFTSRQDIQDTVDKDQKQNCFMLYLIFKVATVWGKKMSKKAYLNSSSEKSKTDLHMRIFFSLLQI